MVFHFHVADSESRSYLEALALLYIYITLYNRVPQRAARVQESPDGGGRLSPIM